MHFIAQYLDIIVFAVIAVVLLFRLRSVLGERSSDEPQGMQLPPQMQEKPAEDTAAAPAPKGKTIEGKAVRLDERWFQNLPNFAWVDTATVHNNLVPFVAVDPSFRPDEFLEKAKKAFAMIVTAFAQGNRNTLEFLLSPGLYRHFLDGIDAREKSNETYHVQLHGVKKAVITEAQLNGTKARVTVDFSAEQSVTHKDSEGRIINEQNGQRQTMHDRWVFEKDLKDNSPAWLLVDTLAYDE